MEKLAMIRRFFSIIVISLMIFLSVAISPVLAEKQYSQTQQTPAGGEQKSTQKPYSQTQQAPIQMEQRPAQKPYSQSQSSYKGGEKQYSQTEQKPDSPSED
jgi:hypothetical protein